MLAALQGQQIGQEVIQRIRADRTDPQRVAVVIQDVRAADTGEQYLDAPLHRCVHSVHLAASGWLCQPASLMSRRTTS